MEIRVQFPRERASPTGAVRKVRPAADRPVDPGQSPNDGRHHDGSHEHQPSSDADIGGHVDKTV